MKSPPFDPIAIRRRFPAFAAAAARSEPFVYLDNAATTQKPQAALDAMQSYHVDACANVHRAAHRLGVVATQRFERARGTLARFVGAAHSDEIVFVRGVTEAVNLVARTFGDANVGPGDDVVVTALEHHSNLVPWQMLCERVGARLVVAPVDARGDLDVDAFAECLGPRTRLVATTWIANATGTVVPIADVVRRARVAGAAVLVDAAQAAAHMSIDVRALDCDFLVLSAHKNYGPTGAGVLYGRRERLAAMPPFHGGGDMIERVTAQRSTYAAPPHRFEAGTPDIAAVLGFAAAVEWLQSLDRVAAAAHERRLVDRLVHGLSALPGIRLVGTPRERAAIVAFTVDGYAAHEVAALLDAHGVMIRSGHHCAQPLLAMLGVEECLRMSVAIYNDDGDVDAALRAIAACVGA